MFNFDLDDHSIKTIHFIGIGGVSMSGIAQLLIDSGFKITGSDRESSPHTEKLEQLGAEIYIGQKAENIKNPDIIVYTDAILPDNEELKEALKKDIPVVTRGVFLGALMKNYKHSIAISGSHGKSTVTSMISTVLANSKYKPSILLGGDLDFIDGNVLVGDRDFLITEACEYKANILNYYPSTVIVLNVSSDHLDFFKNLDHIIETFQGYMDNISPEGNAIINIDEENCLPLIPHVKGKVHTFGIENKEADFNITEVINHKGKCSFTLRYHGDKSLSLNLPIIGEFNVYNAAASAIALLVTGVNKDLIVERLSNYKALHRRMEVVGSYKGAEVMTDYGHHPIEIKATLDALKEADYENIICVFQPHTYSRTKALLEEFSQCFDSADEIIVTEIYAAREHLDPTIHSKDLVKLLVEKNKNARYIQTFEETKDYLWSKLNPEDLVITTGCGIPHKLAYMLVEPEGQKAS